jgi:hypothetical protein
MAFAMNMTYGANLTVRGLEWLRDKLFYTMIRLQLSTWLRRRRLWFGEWKLPKIVQVSFAWLFLFRVVFPNYSSLVAMRGGLDIVVDMANTPSHLSFFSRV